MPPGLEELHVLHVFNWISVEKMKVYDMEVNTNKMETSFLTVHLFTNDMMKTALKTWKAIV